jgi:DnaA regulatory inactivator Hda
LSGQLTFDLGARAAHARGDFFASPANEGALAALARWQSWPARQLLILGAKGSGKTHLAHIWAAEVGALFFTGTELVASDLEPGRALVVDDADAVAGNAAAETALFHLHNMVLQGGGRLLMTARLPLRDWGLRLPDLASRVAAADVAQLAPPDDALLSALLVKLFADRQIQVPPNLVTYLVKRMERSVAAAGALVAALDQLALATQRPVTRALAAELLDSAGDE